MSDEGRTGRNSIDDIVEEITGHFDWDDSDWMKMDDGEPVLEQKAPPEEPLPEEEQTRPPRDWAELGRRAAKYTIYLCAVLLISFLIATVGWRWANDVLALNKESHTASVTVAEGESLDDIANELAGNGLIRYQYLFKFFADVTGKGDKIVAGSYELSTDMDYSALLRNLSYTSANRETVKVTIPEGYTVDEVFKILSDRGVCEYKDLMESAKNDNFTYEFLNDVEARGAERLEGYLFPDTYEFYKETSAQAAISKMLYNFSTRFDDSMEEQRQKLGRSLNEVIIMASIIEKETDGTDQRAIASVLYNRLDNPWATPKGFLQVDSSIQYLLAKRKETLSQEDLEIDSPYNTYLYPGLPVGAICNPGLDAIKAALNPKKTDYYYFMLGKDGHTHFFESEAAFLNYRDGEKD